MISVLKPERYLVEKIGNEWSLSRSWKPKGVTVHAKDRVVFPSKGGRVWFIYVKCVSGRSVLWHCCTEVNWEHVNAAGLTLPETSVVFIAWAIHLHLEWEKLSVVMRNNASIRYFSLRHIKSVSDSVVHYSATCRVQLLQEQHSNLKLYKIMRFDLEAFCIWK